jgi:L-ascorbate metabolism protein UlaG (beta-lactamase superfamily)
MIGSRTVLIAFLAISTVEYGCAHGLPLPHPNLQPFRMYEQPLSSGSFTATFLGTTSILFQDEETAILSDGFVTRPGWPAVVFWRLRSNSDRVSAALQRLGNPSIAAVFTGHSHYDHALDAPRFAKLTGARLVGSESTANAGRGIQLPTTQIRLVQDGETISFRRFKLTFVKSEHGPGDKAAGFIESPLKPPARARKWKTGETWSVFIRHLNRTILIHGSANHRGKVLRNHRADVVYLGIGKLGQQDSEFIEGYWKAVVLATEAKRVVLIHWDDFFRRLDKPLVGMPKPLDDVQNGICQLLKLGARDRVEVILPVVWQASDPFAPLPDHMKSQPIPAICR